MTTWSIAAVLATVKAYGGFIIGGIVIVVGWILRDKNNQIESAKRELRKRQFQDEVKPLQDRANAKTQEIELDEQKAKEAEAKMRAILDGTSAVPGAGPDCKSR